MWQHRCLCTSALHKRMVEVGSRVCCFIALQRIIFSWIHLSRFFYQLEACLAKVDLIRI